MKYRFQLFIDYRQYIIIFKSNFSIKYSQSIYSLSTILEMDQNDMDYFLESEAYKTMEEEYFPSEKPKKNTSFDFQQYMDSLGTFTIPVQRKPHKIIDINNYCRNGLKMSKAAKSAKQSIQFRNRQLQRQRKEPDTLGSKRVKIQQDYYKSGDFENYRIAYKAYDKKSNSRQRRLNKKSGPPYYPTIVMIKKQEPNQIKQSEKQIHQKSGKEQSNQDRIMKNQIKEKTRENRFQSDVKKENQRKTRNYDKYIIKQQHQQQKVDKFQSSSRQKSGYNPKRIVQSNEFSQSSRERHGESYKKSWSKKLKSEQSSEKLSSQKGKNGEPESNFDWNLLQKQIQTMRQQLVKERQKASKIYEQKQREIDRKENLLKESLRMKEELSKMTGNNNTNVKAKAQQRKQSELRRSRTAKSQAKNESKDSEQNWQKQLRKITRYYPSAEKYQKRDKEDILESGFHRIAKQQVKSRVQGEKQERQALQKEKYKRLHKMKQDQIDY